jgi:hypothetical protein
VLPKVIRQLPAYSSDDLPADPSTYPRGESYCNVNHYICLFRPDFWGRVAGL